MLRALDVPSEALIENPNGLSTYDSVQHALSIAKGAPFIIVSQSAHCRRAILLARGMGGDAVAVTAAGTHGSTAISHREQLAAVRAVLDSIGLSTFTTLRKEKLSSNRQRLALGAKGTKIADA